MADPKAAETKERAPLTTPSITSATAPSLSGAPSSEPAPPRPGGALGADPPQPKAPEYTALEEPTGKGSRSLPKCPHDGFRMLQHPEGTDKAGAYHCNDCGCCWNADLNGLRPGALPCNPEARIAQR